MILLDAHLSPALGPWITATFGVECRAAREMELRNADDAAIYQACRRPGWIVMTKDADFPAMLDRLGPPPQVIWLTCGNTSNLALKHLLSARLPEALTLLQQGEPLVEIGPR